MEDRIAREGTLARCNADREATLRDIDCANARRAQASIALLRERERREQLERESQSRIDALRAEMAERERIAREQALVEARLAEEAYDALWRPQSESVAAGSAEPDVAPGSTEPVVAPGRAEPVIAPGSAEPETAGPAEQLNPVGAPASRAP